MDVAYRTLLGDLRNWVWDVRHGVNTRERIPVSELGINGVVNTENAGEYASSNPLEVLTGLHLHWPSYVFIDLGCGKGKVLLLAARLPFARVIGVELSPNLAQIASRNVSTYRRDDLLCGNLTVVRENAATYTFPPEPSVIYCFNAFSGPVLSAVLRNLRKSLEEHPRNLYLFYWNPVAESVVAQTGFLKLVESGRDYRIWSSAAALN